MTAQHVLERRATDELGAAEGFSHIVGKWGSVAGFGHFAFCYYGRQHAVSNS